MNITAPPSVGHVRVELDAGEALHVLHPQAIAAFRGNPLAREDRFMDLGGALRKKRWTRAKLTGPCRFILGLPPGFTLEMIDIPEEGHLLFDFRHVMLITDGVAWKSKVLKWKTAWITRDLVRMKFTGPGKVGVLSAGALAVERLDPETPLFVDKNALIAYPEDADIRLSVYGNPLASQQMNVQWELRGRGPVLLQTGAPDAALMEKLSNDSWFKRLLREILPYGSVYIK